MAITQAKRLVVEGSHSHDLSLSGNEGRIRRSEMHGVRFFYIPYRLFC